MSAATRRLLRIHTVVLTVCALILAWLVISRSFAAYLAGIDPHAALWLNASEPDALVRLADQRLNRLQSREVLAQSADHTSNSHKDAAGGIPAAKSQPGAKLNANGDFAEFAALNAQSAADLPAIRAGADAGLMSAPLNARALRILGQAADATGNNMEAAKYMRLAAQLSLHESVAIYWLLIQSAEAKDYKAAIYYADIALRTLPGFDSYVAPILAQIAEDKKSASLLKAVINGNPPWRGNFLQDLPRYVTDERVPLELLLSLRATSHPPTLADVNNYLDFLVQHEMFEFAYYSWLQFLPAEQLASSGLLYNGSFEAGRNGSPFDWNITEGAGVDADIEEKPDKLGDHALVLNFEYGRVDYHSVRQLIMLPAGQYQFEGQYRGELVGPRGLKWRVACAESAERPLAESAMITGSAPAWREIKIEFAIPGRNCRAQYLSLDLDARMPSEEFITGSIWFDDLQISRAASALGAKSGSR